MKNYIRMTNRNISIIIFFVVVVSCVFDVDKNRIKISDLSIGKKLDTEIFDTIKDNFELDFPYKEVNLKNNKSIILYVVGKENFIYKLRWVNISNDTCVMLCSDISKKLGLQPKYQKEILVSGVWNCETYSWKDDLHGDYISLAKCIHKNDLLPKDNKWELTIENDSLYKVLLKTYNVNTDSVALN